MSAALLSVQKNNFTHTFKSNAASADVPRDLVSLFSTGFVSPVGRQSAGKPGIRAGFLGKTSRPSYKIVRMRVGSGPNCLTAAIARSAAPHHVVRS